MKTLSNCIREGLLNTHPDDVDNMATASAIQEYLNRLGSKKRVDRVEVTDDKLIVTASRDIGSRNYLPRDIYAAVREFRLGFIKEAIMIQDPPKMFSNYLTLAPEKSSIEKWTFQSTSNRSGIQVYMDFPIHQNLELVDKNISSVIEIHSQYINLENMRAEAGVIRLDDNSGQSSEAKNCVFQAHQMLEIQDMKNGVPKYLDPLIVKELKIDSAGLVHRAYPEIPYKIQDILGSDRLYRSIHRDVPCISFTLGRRLAKQPRIFSLQIAKSPSHFRGSEMVELNGPDQPYIRLKDGWCLATTYINA